MPDVLRKDAARQIDVISRMPLKGAVDIREMHFAPVF